MTRGYWQMHCFNGLSHKQQVKLVKEGSLPFGYQPEGKCQNPAELEVTTMYDVAPGPRFYCLRCAIRYLQWMDQS